jgi:hypothetical protein
MKPISIRLFCPIFLTLLLTPLGGCGSAPTLHLHGIDTGNRLAQQFEQGGFDRGSQGDYIVVLDQQDPQSRQIVVLHVLYKPRLGSRADHPTAVNAAIDWFLFSDPSDLTRGVLHYEGSGFVAVNAGDAAGKFTIRNATLQLKYAGGNVKDAIGKATLEGKFKVPRDSGLVASIAREMRELGRAAATTSTQPTEDNQPPARTPTP